MRCRLQRAAGPDARASRARSRSIPTTAWSCEPCDEAPPLRLSRAGACIGQLADFARKHGKSKSLIVEAALASFLSPDDADGARRRSRRRLDRLTRQIERLERDLSISIETLALFVRFWLTSTPPLPEPMQAAARAKGSERYEKFVEALGDGSRPARRCCARFPKTCCTTDRRQAIRSLSVIHRPADEADSAVSFSFYADARRRQSLVASARSCLF